MSAEQAATTTTSLPPGPRGKPIFGNALDIQRDALTALTDGWRAHGDIVCFRGIGSIFPIYLVVHPEGIQHIFQDNFRNYERPGFARKKLRMFVGNGLITTEGELWARQRRRTQAAFHRDRVVPLGSTMTDTTAEFLDRWNGYAQRGEPIEIQSEMMELVLAILTRSLFGAEMSRHVETIKESVAIQAKHVKERLASPIDIPERAPIPSQRRFLQARGTLDRLVDRVIAERRRAGVAADDLVSTLLDTSDGESEETISDEQARDELKTLLIAGHETTAISLAWLCYLLSLHPAAADRLRAEVQEVVGDRPPVHEDIPNLRYTMTVIHEALRLYPPLWLVLRMPVEDDEIGGYPVPAGSTIFLCTYLTHRHPHFWENPEGFDPERFTPERSEGRHRYAYIPFAAGPHGCIGYPFAMMEMPLVLAQIVQRFRLTLVPGYPVVPESATSLRLKDGALMYVEHAGPSRTAAPSQTAVGVS